METEDEEAGVRDRLRRSLEHKLFTAVVVSGSDAADHCFNMETIVSIWKQMFQYGNKLDLPSLYLHLFIKIGVG